MEAEIISIGTELLLGEIVDTNTRHIALVLRENGVDLYRTSTIGDNADRIGDAVRSSMSRAQAVITTGGLGPTVDDATREGIAKAAGVDLVFQENLWDQIQARFASFGRVPTENNKRQAFLPDGAIAISNPVGTAPGFIIETETSCAIAIPGVPAEMEYLLASDVIPYLRNRFRLSGLIKAKRIRTAGVGESALSTRIGDLEEMSNPTVGFSAHPGRVDIRITAKANSEHEADEMIWKIEATIRQRLGDAIYGTDDETLEHATLEMLSRRNWDLVVLECGASGWLTKALNGQGAPFIEGRSLEGVQDPAAMKGELHRLMADRKVEAGLGLYLDRNAGIHFRIDLITPEKELDLIRTFPGGYPNAEEASVSIAINSLRKLLHKLNP
jgi:nicotinamide-nucleotide amidase